MANAVLVIDMVCGFFDEGYSLYLGSQARRIIPNVKKLLDTELAKGSKILFLCDNHDPDDLEFTDSYLIRKVWLFLWKDLNDQRRFLEKRVRGEHRGYYVRIKPSLDEEYLIYQKEH